MSRRITFANRKGGCGKTTSAVNVAHALALNGKKVLFIDIDPQAHSTLIFNNSSNTPQKTIYHFLCNKYSLSECKVKTRIANLDLIPASRELTAFEIEYSTKQDCALILSQRLNEESLKYDYIVFDPPPTVGLLSMSALVTSNEILIPMQMHFYAMEGLAEMMQLIYKVNASYNPNLFLVGIIPTFLNERTKLAGEIFNDIVNHFGGEKLFPGIRTNITLAEAPGYKKTIFEYAPQSNGAKDYMKLTGLIELKGDVANGKKQHIESSNRGSSATDAQRPSISEGNRLVS